jgi:hypothetical protein
MQPIDHLRGDAAPKPYDARKIAALTTNPGCSRRALLDAAGIDKEALAAAVGRPGRFGQSPFALARGNVFEDIVKRDGYAELFTLLRDTLGAPVADATVTDLKDTSGHQSMHDRHARTLAAFRAILDGGESRTILDHPILTLEVAGQTAYLEPDAVTHPIGGRFHIVEIKSFAAIDGQADPAKVAEAAKQAAVYVLALRKLVAELGHSEDLVSTSFLLACPKDFALRPFGGVVDIRQQIDAVAFQLGRLRRAEDIAAALPPDARFDLTATPAELRSAIDALDARYAPACMASCEMAMYCRAEATACQATARLGSGFRDEMPGVDTVLAAADLIDGGTAADEGGEDVAELLRAAARIRARVLAGTV